MERIIIIVQKYNKDNTNYVYCSNLSNPGANFRLHKNYIKTFANKPQVDHAYFVEYCQEPSKCGEFMNHKINVITELSIKDALSMTMS
jgi:hypothetical protein